MKMHCLIILRSTFKLAHYFHELAQFYEMLHATLSSIYDAQSDVDLSAVCDVEFLLFRHVALWNNDLFPKLTFKQLIKLELALASIGLNGSMYKHLFAPQHQLKLTMFVDFLNLSHFKLIQNHFLQIQM